jgi:hypothetical protein
MAKRIGVLERDERLDRRPRRFVDQETSKLMIQRKLARAITASLIQLSIAVAPGQERMTLRGFTDGELGIGNALPFFKVQNPLLQPTKLHYSTPMANDIGIRRWGFRSAHSEVGKKDSAPTIGTRLIRVSARSRHNTQILPAGIPVAALGLAGSISA